MIITVVTGSGKQVNVEVSPDDKTPVILAKLKKAGVEVTDSAKLITDGSKQLYKIIRSDPVNRWFDGKPGDIYRIESRDGIRFRKVT